ncbi:MAG: ROK family protein [Cyclobacteriaceae bacterium]
MLKIGIDLGGTKIEGIVLDNGNNVIDRKRIPTEQELGYNHIMKNLIGLYHSLLDGKHDQKHRVGIGTPGYSNREGLLKNSSLLCLNEKPFLKDFENYTSVRPDIENDANCFAVAEALMGAGKGKKLVFGVIMGTGCGGGIVSGGAIIRGSQYLGGEIGHATLYPDGVDCFCGKRGCVERYISGSGVQEQYQIRTGQKMRLENIVDAYRNGDENASAVMKSFFNNFGLVMSNLINMLDPDQIVLGGGVSNIEELYTEGIERVARYVFKDDPIVNIAKNQLGDSAGVFGAALLGDSN